MRHQHHCNGRGSGGRLEHQGDDSSREHEKEYAPDAHSGKRSKEEPDTFVVEKDGGSFLESGEAQEEQGETHQELAEIPVLLSAHQHIGEEHQRDGNGTEAETARSEAQGEYPCCHGGAYVGTHDHPYGACKSKQSRIHETHYHERSGRGTLNHGGYHDSGEDALEGG